MCPCNQLESKRFRVRGPRKGRNGRLRSVLDSSGFKGRKKTCSQRLQKRADGRILPDAGVAKMEILVESARRVLVILPENSKRIFASFNLGVIPWYPGTQFSIALGMVPRGLSTRMEELCYKHLNMFLFLASQR